MKNELINDKSLIFIVILLTVHFFIFTDLKYVPYIKARGDAPGYINIAPLGLSKRRCPRTKARGDAPFYINLVPKPGAMPLAILISPRWG
ncbi:MAG: hypothetical protein DRR08_20165 [Candidatus Parabeggiatoa sp. nov. 2]|nr:MAG: hypothetical protein B6247_19620 [Beggiatoa sp. 4572_84]RKZ57014.1 MAG: hypothetical protein DRR08_20165 [Gammaproteobacteria bacterium]